MHNFDVWRATYHRNIHLLVAYMDYQPDHPDRIIILQEFKFSVCAAPKKNERKKQKRKKNCFGSIIHFLYHKCHHWATSLSAKAQEAFSEQPF